MDLHLAFQEAQLMYPQIQRGQKDGFLLHYHLSVTLRNPSAPRVTLEECIELKEAKSR